MNVRDKYFKTFLEHELISTRTGLSSDEISRLEVNRISTHKLIEVIRMSVNASFDTETNIERRIVKYLNN